MFLWIPETCWKISRKNTFKIFLWRCNSSFVIQKSICIAVVVSESAMYFTTRYLCVFKLCPVCFHCVQKLYLFSFKLAWYFYSTKSRQVAKDISPRYKIKKIFIEATRGLCFRKKVLSVDLIRNLKHVPWPTLFVTLWKRKFSDTVWLRKSCVQTELSLNWVWHTSAAPA